MPENEPNLVDYLTLAAAVVGPFAGVYTTLWTVKRAERLRFDVHIDWVDFGPNNPIGEAPFLYIQNNSKDSILITEVKFRTGLWFRKRQSGTAVDYEDPMDLSFPYLVKPGELQRLRISYHLARKYLLPEGWCRKVADLLRRSTLWLEVRTATGRTKTVGAEEVLPWKERPTWTKT